MQSCPPSYFVKHNNEPYNSRARRLAVRASAESSDNFVPSPPLEFESPVGQLLEQILQTHPHLVSETIDQELEKLQNERESHKEESSTSDVDSLYK